MKILRNLDFFEQCEAWRYRETDLSTLYDIYDGSLWKEFMEYNGVPFLSVPYCFALSLNVDWFQPYKHTQHSIGVLYIAIQNLPREVRFLVDNVIIVGIIPGPHEPPKNINSFLAPLVDELQDLWKGVFVNINANNLVSIRAALICVSCDIPAARKVCGFVGHNAYQGCNKCLKSFPTESFGEKADFSGFDRDNWTKRDLVSHRQHAFAHKSSSTASQQAHIEREHGIRYTKLLDLPYFDPVRMCVVDPMHNLLLGTAKHMVSVWKDRSILSKKDLEDIQNRVDSFVTPNDIGRLPANISSSFSGFTADQWINWTIFFSLYSLKGILPHRDFSCWQLFVKACHIICRRQISLEQLNHADNLLLEFLNAFENLYGKEFCTINLHLHAHLKSCILDYGPVYSFWLFAFERMNGVLGSFQTNCHDISVQLMRRFLHIRIYATHNWPNEFRDEFSPFIKKFNYNKGSLSQASLSRLLNQSPEITSLPPVYESAFESHMKVNAHSIISNNITIDSFTVLTLFEKCGAVKVGRFVLGSVSSRFSTVSIVKVKTLGKEKLAEVQYYAKCTITSQASKSLNFWLAAVSFFPEHQCKHWYGRPTEVWGGISDLDVCFLPLCDIQDRVTFTKSSVHFGQFIGTDKVIVITPLP